jgi:hypothetical protein
MWIYFSMLVTVLMCCAVMIHHARKNISNQKKTDLINLIHFSEQSIDSSLQIELAKNPKVKNN